MALFDRIRSVLRGGRHRSAAAPAPAAAAAPAPSLPEQGRLRRHTVLPGQTLEEIAQQHGVSAAGMAELNGIEQPELIYPGQVFRVPGGEEPQPVSG